MNKPVALSTLARHFRPDAGEIALNTLAEINDNYNKAKTVLARLPPLEMKYVLRVLRRAADKPSLAVKLKHKKNRLDNDTIDMLGLETDQTPTQEAISDRIRILESYRKLRGGELGRFHCGWLRTLYENYGANPTNHARLRSFALEALDIAGISHPDPDKHPDRLDAWITTPVEQPLDPAIHGKAANQAARRP